MLFQCLNLIASNDCINRLTHLYKSLSKSSATVFNNLLTNVFSCSPVCPDAATAKLYFCSSSICLFCNLTYSWRNRLRCRSSLATWPIVVCILEITECSIMKSKIITNIHTDNSSYWVGLSCSAVYYAV